MNPEVIGQDPVDRLCLGNNMDQHRLTVDTVINLKLPHNTADFYTD
jgi:hypothetical protein